MLEYWNDGTMGSYRIGQEIYPKIWRKIEKVWTKKKFVNLRCFLLKLLSHYAKKAAIS